MKDENEKKKDFILVESRILQLFSTRLPVRTNFPVRTTFPVLPCSAPQAECFVLQKMFFLSYKDYSIITSLIASHSKRINSKQKTKLHISDEVLFYCAVPFSSHLSAQVTVRQLDA